MLMLGMVMIIMMMQGAGQGTRLACRERVASQIGTVLIAWCNYSNTLIAPAL